MDRFVVERHSISFQSSHVVGADALPKLLYTMQAKTRDLPTPIRPFSTSVRIHLCRSYTHRNWPRHFSFADVLHTRSSVLELREDAKRAGSEPYKT